jgi:hypothetical protein
MRFIGLNAFNYLILYKLNVPIANGDDVADKRAARIYGGQAGRNPYVFNR